MGTTLYDWRSRKYSDFVGRGCPSQSGHRFSIQASGDSHTCVMEDASYGDIFKNGLKATYAKTQFCETIVFSMKAANPVNI